MPVGIKSLNVRFIFMRVWIQTKSINGAPPRKEFLCSMSWKLPLAINAVYNQCYKFWNS